MSSSMKFSSRHLVFTFALVALAVLALVVVDSSRRMRQLEAPYTQQRIQEVVDFQCNEYFADLCSRYIHNSDAYSRDPMRFWNDARNEAPGDRPSTRRITDSGSLNAHFVIAGTPELLLDAMRLPSELPEAIVLEISVTDRQGTPVAHGAFTNKRRSIPLVWTTDKHFADQ